MLGIIYIVFIFFIGERAGAKDGTYPALASLTLFPLGQAPLSWDG